MGVYRKPVTDMIVYYLYTCVYAYVSHTTTRVCTGVYRELAADMMICDMYTCVYAYVIHTRVCVHRRVSRAGRGYDLPQGARGL